MEVGTVWESEQMESSEMPVLTAEDVGETSEAEVPLNPNVDYGTPDVQIHTQDERFRLSPDLFRIDSDTVIVEVPAEYTDPGAFDIRISFDDE